MPESLVFSDFPDIQLMLMLGQNSKTFKIRLNRATVLARLHFAKWLA